ncbi:hypothetical protein BUALT_Bualt06G0066900 [Buddleja alternifolia]|uniref:Uncharacterized protein n=1 Tax=Buddleja alternifolia TaxID=168488 RepID=A0AAV6XCT4_9LAMI|nr:hypothetical protein BUALT_Bualt06G0066900 [Buddleja alternifolia]
MGKSIPSPQNLQQFARLITSTTTRSRRPAHLKPVSKTRPISSPDPSGSRPDLKLNNRPMEAAAESSERRRRMPLAEVVADCVKRWFQDTLKDAKTGDTSMQVLVGQMYYSGYGVGRDEQKGKAWISRASKIRSSVWKVGDKHPGYNASDSDSDDMKEDAK